MSQEAPTAPCRRPPRARVDPLIGEVLAGRYVIGAQLGRGGMGRVYEGHDLVRDEGIAVKVLVRSDERLHGEGPSLRGPPLHPRAPDVDPSLAARFRREARLASSFSHPNVVATRDHGETERGLLWLVMDLCPGRTLSHVLSAERALSPRRAVGIAAQVLDALAAAHARGIVHRDVKASNIMIDEEGGVDRVRVLDFGLATALDHESKRLTARGLVVGSPRTMSPEQCRGDVVDARADVYSVGVVLYQLLAGAPPFDDADAQKLLWKHVSEPPPPLRDAPGLVLPAALEGAIARALEKEPDDRWGSAEEFARALRDVEVALAPRRHPFGARVRAPGARDTLVVVGRSGDVLLARGRGRELLRVEQAEREPGLGCGVRAGDAVLVRVDGDARPIRGALAARPTPDGPLVLRRADGGPEVALPRQDVREVDLLFPVTELRVGDRFRARSRAGNDFAGRVAWVADGRAGAELDGGETTTLVLSRLDPSTFELRVAVPLDALWADALVGFLPGS